jgi:hypothetical protein
MATAPNRSTPLVIGSRPLGVALAPWPVRPVACDGCAAVVPSPGCRRYGRVTFCPRCSTAYLAAWDSGQRLPPDQFRAVPHRATGDDPTALVPA